MKFKVGVLNMGLGDLFSCCLMCLMTYWDMGAGVVERSATAVEEEEVVVVIVVVLVIDGGDEEDDIFFIVGVDV